MADITARAILIDKMSAPMKKIQDNSSKMSKSIKDSAKNTSESLKGTASSLVSLKGAFVGLAVAGVGVFAKSILSAGSEMEKLETQFKVLLKDTDSAKARMQELSKFAQTTPFQLDEVAKASKILQTLGGTTLATGDGLRMVGDAAAISGESFENLSIHVGRAYSGLQSNRPIGESLARLQELGLVTGETRNKIESLTKQAKGKEAWKILQGELGKTKGGMGELSQTMGGLTSTLKDQFQAVLRDLGKGGFFDSMKDGLKGVVAGMNNLLDSGFFLRVGAGFQLIHSASMIFFNGLQVSFSRANQIVAEFIGGAIAKLQSVVNVLPKSIVPDGWVQGLENARTSFEVTANQFKTMAEEDLQDGAKAVDSLLDSWNNVTNGVKIEKYVEKVQKATNVTQEMTDKQKKALTKRLEDDSKFYEELSQNMREGEREVRIGLMSEEDQKRELLREKQQERIELLGETSEVMLLNQKETAELEKEIQREKFAEVDAMAKRSAEFQKSLLMAQLNASQTYVSSLATIMQNALKGDKKNAKLRKAIAISEAIINTSLGVTKALASAPPPINFINASAVGAQGLAQVSTIATQKFAKGGIVKGEGGISDIGDKTLIRVNAGEGVFTKDQMKAMGSQKAVTIAPSIVINGNADQGVVDQLVDKSKEIAEAVVNSIRNGDLDLNAELNLVSA